MFLLGVRAANKFEKLFKLSLILVNAYFLFLNVLSRPQYKISL